MDTSIYKRSGIPVSVTPLKSVASQMRKLSKGSDGNSLNSLENDMDVFTLLEENISLKESKSQLIAKNLETIQKNVALEQENGKLCKQLDESRKQQESLKDQLKRTMEKFDKQFQEYRIDKNIQEELKQIVSNLRQKLRTQEKQLEQLVEISQRTKLGIDESDKISDEREDKSDVFATETIERLVNDISNIKANSNVTELQLYEANEKNAELIETNNLLEEENQTLKIENMNLQKVSKMMTTSMRESIDTSKKMEQAFIKIRKRNDELTEENREMVDSPVSPKSPCSPMKSLQSEDVVKLREEFKKKEVIQNERIVEMTKLMETNYRIEYELLQLKLEIVESNLQIAIERAERAESQLETLRNQQQQQPSQVLPNSSHISSIENKATNTSPIQINPPEIQSLLPMLPPPPPPIPPPPPPPLPPPLLLSSSSSTSSTLSQLPPALRRKNLELNLPPINNSSGTSLGNGIATLTLRKLNENQQHNSPSNQQVKATGMDALIAQLKDGKVTLRRTRDKPKYSAAINEMFDVLEKVKQQNRQSVKLVDDAEFAYNNVPAFDI